MTPLDLLMIGAVLATFWLLILRPARLRRRAREAIMADLAPGKRVMTTAGLFGTVVSVEPGLLRLQVARGVVLSMVPEAIGRVLPDPGVDDPGESQSGEHDLEQPAARSDDAAPAGAVESPAGADESPTRGEEPVDRQADRG